MIAALRLVAAQQSGAAAAEMALVIPLLLTLMFGSFELGNFFLSEHVVEKGVRDAARYAARLPMTNYPACSVSSGAEQKIQRVARTGRPDGTIVRLRGWTADNMVTVTMQCDTTGYYQGVYTGFPGGVPKITVSAAVPYPSLFGILGIGNPSLTLNAKSQAAVFGA